MQIKNNKYKKNFQINTIIKLYVGHIKILIFIKVSIMTITINILKIQKKLKHIKMNMKNYKRKYK